MYVLFYLFQLWKKSGAWFFGSIPPHVTVSASNTNMHESTRPLTPKSSPLAARRNAAVPKRQREETPDNPDTCSTGFGDDTVQIHIHRYKSGMFSRRLTGLL